jgi:predicted nucleotidyltransferase
MWSAQRAIPPLPIGRGACGASLMSTAGVVTRRRSSQRCEPECEQPPTESPEPLPRATRPTNGCSRRASLTHFEQRSANWPATWAASTSNGGLNRTSLARRFWTCSWVGPTAVGRVRVRCGEPCNKASKSGAHVGGAGPYSRWMAEPAEVMTRLAADLAEVLGDDLLSLALHGSWVLGDFAPGRSDLDVLAVLATDPTAATLAELDDVHARLEADFPEWSSHVEVDYVSAEAVEAVVQGTDESHPMIRISPGEPLHEVKASRHYVLNWAAALQADQPIAGAAPSTVLPAIDRRLIHQVVLQHVRAWPEWVHDMQATGAQAYAVLTLCRAAETLATRRQVSKLAAANAGRSRFPGMVRAHRLGPRLVVPGRIGLRSGAVGGCAPIC